MWEIFWGSKKRRVGSLCFCFSVENLCQNNMLSILGANFIWRYMLVLRWLKYNGSSIQQNLAANFWFLSWEVGRPGAPPHIKLGHGTWHTMIVETSIETISKGVAAMQIKHSHLVHNIKIAWVGKYLTKQGWESPQRDKFGPTTANIMCEVEQMWWNMSWLVEYRNMSNICGTQCEYFDRIPTPEPKKIVDNEMCDYLLSQITQVHHMVCWAVRQFVNKNPTTQKLFNVPWFSKQLWQKTYCPTKT